MRSDLNGRVSAERVRDREEDEDDAEGVPVTGMFFKFDKVRHD